MEAKTGREAAKELHYIGIQTTLASLAGTDCLAVVYNDHVYTIGNNCNYRDCQDFIIDMIVDDPKKFCKQGCFDSLNEMYGYLFDCAGDEDEMRDFLKDYFNAEDMNEYGKG